MLQTPNKNLKTIGSIAIIGVALLCSITPARSTHAASSWEENKSFTFSETVSANHYYNELIDATCHHDPVCEGNEYRNYKRSENYGAYAASLLESTPIVLTSVNPTTGQATVYFNDHSNTFPNRQFDNSELPHVKVDSFSISWQTKDSPDQKLTFSDPNILRPQTETTFSLGDPLSLKGTMSEAINYSYLINTISANNMYDISECLNSDSYVRGMECRVYVTKLYNFSYYPAWPSDVDPTLEDKHITQYPASSSTKPNGYLKPSTSTSQNNPNFSTETNSSQSAALISSVSQPKSTTANPATISTTSDIPNTSPLPLAPNTGIAPSALSKTNLLQIFTFLLVLTNLLLFTRYLIKHR